MRPKKRPLRILEVGCGNGWLSNLLASVPGTKVTGIDINSTELIQAKRVFQKINLDFFETDIRSMNLHDEYFDMIIFAASIQYFPSIYSVLNNAFQLLKAEGEVHILDTFFYKNNELEAAQKRTSDYYDSLGMNAFRMFYFHHSSESFAAYNFQVMYQPSWYRKIFQKQNPFKWYCLKR